MAYDPTSARGREITRKLVETADIVVANLPDRTLERMGLSYPQLCAIKPDIILVTMSAFGTQGPWKDRVGFDSIGQAMCGAAYLSGSSVGPARTQRSEEHTSELQSLMRISYAVFCLKKKKNTHNRKKHKCRMIKKQ